jgi:hypothetical protein
MEIVLGYQKVAMWVDLKVG